MPLLLCYIFQIALSLWESILLYSPSWYGPHYVAQAWLKHMAIPLLCPLSVGITDKSYYRKSANKEKIKQIIYDSIVKIQHLTEKPKTQDLNNLFSFKELLRRLKQNQSTTMDIPIFDDLFAALSLVEWGGKGYVRRYSLSGTPSKGREQSWLVSQ